MTDLVVGAAAALSALATLGAVAQAWGLTRRDLAAWPTRLSVAAAVTWVALFAWLLALFLTSRIEHAMVFFYSAKDLDLAWRFVGTWASRQGSFLLWAACMAVLTAALQAHAWAVTRAARGEATAAGGVDGAATNAQRTAAMMGVLTTLFALACALDAPFGRTPDALLSGNPTGNGLTPSLRSPFMLIHPPMMFIAYALAAVPAAASLAYVFGARSWSEGTATWSRWAWAVTTCAMGLGALWAYTTLGFGGYWSWDPVEVANLLPWLALTVYLHARLQNERHGDFARIGPLLGVLPLLFTIFSTVSTRSGLWVSVHAFTDPTNTFNPDAAGRFLDILRAEPALSYPVAIAFALWWGFLAAWTWRLGRSTHPRAARFAALPLAGLAAAALVDATGTVALVLEASRLVALGNTGLGLLALMVLTTVLAAWPLLADRSEPRRMRFDVRTLAAYAVLALAAALLVLFLFHMAAVNGWDTRFYESRFPYLALPVLAGLAGFAAHAFGRRAAWAAALGVPAVALVMARLGDPGTALGAASLAIAVLGLWRVRGLLATGRAGLAAWLLVLAALCDVVFWIHPPASFAGVGLLEAPKSFLFAAASLLALAGAVRLACGGAPPRAGALFLFTGILFGYGVGLLLALAAWALWRTSTSRPHWSPLRVRQVALQGVHIALALALVGYAASTYGKTSTTLELASAERQDVAGWGVEYVGTPAALMPGLPADDVSPVFFLHHGDERGVLLGHLGWYRGSGTYLASPDQHAAWDGDLYLDVQAVHVAPGGTCPNDPEGRWVEAFQVEEFARLCEGDTLDAVRVSVVVLPGLALLWGAWALGLASVVALALLRAPPSKPEDRRGAAADDASPPDAVPQGPA